MGSHALSDEVRAVLDAVRRIVQGLRASSSAAERRVGLSGAQLFVLSRLAAEQPLSQAELAARTFTHQSSVSVVVQRLVERGLVTVAAAPGDRRRQALSLTKKGSALVGRAPDAAQERLIQAVEQLAPAKRRALAGGLTELVAAMALDEAAPPMFFEERSPRPRSRA
jgi:DNA-binding MarR family transcriptional regulator